LRPYWSCIIRYRMVVPLEIEIGRSRRQVGEPPSPYWPTHHQNRSSVGLALYDAFMKKKKGKTLGVRHPSFFF
jgi:hypothetical protein